LKTLSKEKRQSPSQPSKSLRLLNLQSLRRATFTLVYQMSNLNFRCVSMSNFALKKKSYLNLGLKMKSKNKLSYS
jgi:hypothetical protein